MAFQKQLPKSCACYRFVTKASRNSGEARRGKNRELLATMRHTNHNPRRWNTLQSAASASWLRSGATKGRTLPVLLIYRNSPGYGFVHGNLGPNLRPWVLQSNDLSPGWHMVSTISLCGLGAVLFSFGIQHLYCTNYAILEPFPGPML